ncbi:hypothetical protein [Massilia sp. WG5]|uniref:hypothetical protein n=1 Tax=Massilia sp. WG5 TaxID=1707785 RepID=UPI000B0A1C94|nr:hypothetical protein [Massilia sp. WG5]
MSGKTQAAVASAGANDSATMSAAARTRMRRRERDVFNYYDGMGPGKGNCTWGQASWRIAGHAPPMKSAKR